jgi:hypothetical protein
MAWEIDLGDRADLQAQVLEVPSGGEQSSKWLRGCGLFRHGSPGG